MSIPTIAQVGGIVALLVLLHFVADWIFQSHAEAMAKPTNHWVRARHCFVYTLLCLVGIGSMLPDYEVLLWTSGILFFSHFLEDTYLPVLVWARYIRKPPEMVGAKLTLGDFRAFAETTLGKILLIAVDQIVHVVFLLPVALMIVIPERSALFGAVGASMVLGLFGLCLLGRRVLG